MIRGDLSNRVIHLTKGTTLAEAGDAFNSIVREGRLRGGNGMIRGGYTCVCFSEAPISVLSAVLSNRHGQENRYAPFGVMIHKLWLFEQGGRPVIYQPDEEFDALPEELKYRHVRYEPHRNIDHTAEREWRIQTRELVINPATATLVVPTREWEERFLQEHADHLQGMALVLGEDAAIAIDKFPWHFIALEDLGVEFQW